MHKITTDATRRTHGSAVVSHRLTSREDDPRSTQLWIAHQGAPRPTKRHSRNGSGKSLQVLAGAMATTVIAPVSIRCCEYGRAFLPISWYVLQFRHANYVSCLLQKSRV